MNTNHNSLIQMANTTIIRYPRFNELHEKIKMYWEISQIAGEPQCMVLEGGPGAGKSTLVKSYAWAFPRHQAATGTKIPVFYMETPSPVTEKGLACRMLEELGDPAAHKGPLWSMNSRLIDYIGRWCEVELVILDDFHHLIDKETNKILEQVSDWLKVLIKETGVPFLVVGIEGKITRILEVNKQLSRLFATPEVLESFVWKSTEKEKSKEFAHFIKYAEEGIQMPLDGEMERAELLTRIHWATGGIIGNIMNLMRFAALFAQKQGEETITINALKLSYENRLQQHMQLKENPFTLPKGRKPKSATLPDPPNSTNNRSKRRKKRGPSDSEVLKT